MTPLFTLENLRFAAGGRTLLHGLDLSLPAGQITALIGHNGSGKSTLLKLLARQQRPTSGMIRFDGQPLEALKPRAFARQLAYLPQKPAPTDGMTVAELVALGRYPWHGALGRPTPADRAAITEAITACGLEPMQDRMVNTLSGGEAQRAWIAMLVAQDAQCLLLDEPTSALDIAHQIEVLTLIDRLCRTQNRSIVIVLHDLNMAARFAHHIIALRQGQVVFQGTPDALMTPATLQSVTGVAMDILPRTDAVPVALPR